METGRKTRLRRILRRKRIKRAIKAYGNCRRTHRNQYRPRSRQEAPQKKRKRTRSTLCHLTGTGKHWTAGHAMKYRRTTQTTAGIYRIEKLVKIKALAERGIGGEQQTAQVMYATLKEKYKVTDAEIEKAAAVPVDISEIDLKKFWGIAFQLAAVAQTLQEEMDICTACPYTYTDEQCTGCGTYWNMRDLRLDFEAIQQRLIKAATEE